PGFCRTVSCLGLAVGLEGVPDGVLTLVSQIIDQCLSVIALGAGVCADGVYNTAVARLNGLDRGSVGGVVRIRTAQRAEVQLAVAEVLPVVRVRAGRREVV